jgi:hypothetical protein
MSESEFENFQNLPSGFCLNEYKKPYPVNSLILKILLQKFLSLPDIMNSFRLLFYNSSLL